MAPEYEIDFQTPQPSRCACCDGLVVSATRFVYRNGEAFAVYCTEYSNAHPDSGIAVLITLGEWNDDSDPGQRVVFFCRVWPTEAAYAVTLDDAHESPWDTDSLGGQLLSREDATEHPWKATAFEVLDVAMVQDHTLLGFMHRVTYAEPGVPLERAYELPDALHDLEAPDSDAIKHSGNFARLGDDRFFVRCLLPIPVEYYGVWSIGAWVEVAKADFETIRNAWDNPSKYNCLQMSGTLANELDAALNLEQSSLGPVEIHAPDADLPPHIRIRSGPLAHRLATTWPRAEFEAFAVEHGYL